MTRYVTGNEYPLPLPAELPDSAFAEMEKVGGISLNNQDCRECEAIADKLMEGFYRHQARPEFAGVKKRARELRVILRSRKITKPDDLRARLNRVLPGQVGELLRSLLNCYQLVLLSPAELKLRRQAMLATIQRLLGPEGSGPYAGRSGREGTPYVDDFVASFAAVYERAGGHVSGCWDRADGRDTRFTRAIGVFAQAIIKYCVGRDSDFAKYLGPSLAADRLGARIHKATYPAKAA